MFAPSKILQQQEQKSWVLAWPNALHRILTHYIVVNIGRPFAIILVVFFQNIILFFIIFVYLQNLNQMPSIDIIILHLLIHLLLQMLIFKISLWLQLHI